MYHYYVIFRSAWINSRLFTRLLCSRFQITNTGFKYNFCIRIYIHYYFISMFLWLFCVHYICICLFIEFPIMSDFSLFYWSLTLICFQRADLYLSSTIFPLLLAINELYAVYWICNMYRVKQNVCSCQRQWN